MSWQPIFAGVIVLAAALWLARKVYRTVASAVGGGKGYVSSCSTCSTRQQNITVSPLIQLDKKTTSASQSDPDGSK